MSRLLTIREQIILAVVPVAIVLGAVVLLLTGDDAPNETSLVVEAPTAAQTAPVASEPPPPLPEPAEVAPVPEQPQPPQRIGIAIRGAVVRPGLYYMDADQRVQDLLREAGGAAPDADMTDINISAHLQDATTLTIPGKSPETGPNLRSRSREPVMNPPQYTISGWRPGPVPSAPASAGSTTDRTASSGLVNVNTADAAALERLSGIGEVLARRIMETRAEAPFSSIEDLARVRGIGAKTIASLRPYICVR